LKPPEIDFEKQLSCGPFVQSGFTKELQKKILDRIDREPAIPKWWIQLLGTLAFCCALLVASTTLHWKEPLNTMTPEELDLSNVRRVTVNSDPVADLSPSPSVTVRSGLLIGLRTDDEWGESSYRTIYIAPESGKLRKIAEGSGILVPYGQDFWKIAAYYRSADSGKRQYIAAHPANEEPSFLKTGEIPGNGTVTSAQKVLFAGNKYVSVAETDRMLRDHQSARDFDVWVTTIPQLKLSGHSGEPDSRKYSLNEALRTNVSDETGWAIVRKFGQWIPGTVEYDSSAGPDGLAVRDLGVYLPESVVSHDKLCCSREEIAALEPTAEDALSSPTDDLLAIFTDDHISVYVKNGEIAKQPAISIPLMPNEELVMAQWATDRYVDIWADRTKQYLHESREGAAPKAD